MVDDKKIHISSNFDAGNIEVRFGRDMHTADTNYLSSGEQSECDNVNIAIRGHQIGLRMPPDSHVPLENVQHERDGIRKLV